jgi:hypothetical protein
MHRPAVRWVLAIGLGILTATPAFAQFGVANLTHADGAVTRLYSGAPAAATINTSLISGDHIETAAGRAEVTFLDNSVAHLDRDTRIVLAANDGFRLLSGRVSLRTSGYKEYRVETAAAMLIVQAGSAVEIRVQAHGADAFMNVIAGVARIDTPAGVRRVNDYYSAYISGPASAPVVTKTASTQADDFGRWTLARTVMATSTALKGTEGGGGVAYAPVYYAGYGYTQPYYAGSYYQSPYYGSSYYGSSYYANAYYSRPYDRPSYSNLYYAAPYSYYNPYSYAHSYSYPLHRSPGSSWRGSHFLRPAHPIERPMPRSAPPVRGMTRGAAGRRP